MRNGKLRSNELSGEELKTDAGMLCDSRLSKHFPPLPAGPRVFDDEDGSHQRNPRTRPGRRVGFVKPGELRMPRLNVLPLKREQSGNRKRVKPRHLAVTAVSAVN
jgi:hypothetical protein